MLIARPAARASTGSLQDKPLKHRALPAVRASTHLQQAKIIARTAARARTHMLQAVIIARPAARASTGSPQDKPLNPRARTAVRASTGSLQDKPNIQGSHPRCVLTVPRANIPKHQLPPRVSVVHRARIRILSRQHHV